MRERLAHHLHYQSASAERNQKFQGASHHVHPKEESDQQPQDHQEGQRSLDLDPRSLAEVQQAEQIEQNNEGWEGQQDYEEKRSRVINFWELRSFGRPPMAAFLLFGSPIVNYAATTACGPKSSLSLPWPCPQCFAAYHRLAQCRSSRVLARSPDSQSRCRRNNTAAALRGNP